MDIVAWPIGGLVGWLVGWLACGSRVGWLIGLLVGSFSHVLVGSLLAWCVVCAFACLFASCVVWFVN